jgi:hypothetical protein
MGLGNFNSKTLLVDRLSVVLFEETRVFSHF